MSKMGRKLMRSLGSAPSFLKTGGTTLALKDEETVTRNKIKVAY